MKIGIVGCGLVGSTAAYALVMQGIGREIILVDQNEARARAESQDLLHAVPFAHPLQLRPGGYRDLEGARVVIITAGVGQRPGETRMQLLSRNAAVFREVIGRVLAHAPEALLVVATNPVDVMTHLAARYAAEHGVPSSRIVGSGTTLDTARFRSLVGATIDIDPQHVHAYVVGEHGDSEVLIWSLVRAGGMPLADFCRLRGICLEEKERQIIEREVRQAADNIIGGKGATYYGIGAALARIVDVILHDQRSILTLCTPTAEVAGVADVTVSLPRLLGGRGIIETFPLPLNDTEHVALQESARVVRQAIDELEPGGSADGGQGAGPC